MNAQHYDHPSRISTSYASCRVRNWTKPGGVNTGSLFATLHYLTVGIVHAVQFRLPPSCLYENVRCKRLFDGVYFAEFHEHDPDVDCFLQHKSIIGFPCLKPFIDACSHFRWHGLSSACSLWCDHSLILSSDNAASNCTASCKFTFFFVFFTIYLRDGTGELEYMYVRITRYHTDMVISLMILTSAVCTGPHTTGTIFIRESSHCLFRYQNKFDRRRRDIFRITNQIHI